MANERLNIPTKLKVGFQKRTDTYSGKLAYVTYVDKKGKTAKHTSWEHWRSKDMDVLECDNKPMEGFVLNKRVGGYKSGWDFRQTKCRVYDPRGFEIEISVENLLYILQECTSTKGKGLEGEFVYAWQGPELILLPVCSEDYRLSTDLQDRREKIMVKDLKLGAAYKSKESPYIIYIGKMEWYIWEKKEDVTSESHSRRYLWDKTVYDSIRLVKMSTFVDVEKRKFVAYKTTDKLDYLIEENAITLDDVATYVENYKSTSAYKSKDIKTLAIKAGELDKWYKYINDDKSIYTWGCDFLFKRPEDNCIYHARGTKQYIYKGCLLGEWLNKHKTCAWKEIDYDLKRSLEEEFDKGKKLEIRYTLYNIYTFEDGKFRKVSASKGGYYSEMKITEEEWQYMADCDGYRFGPNGGFVTTEGEFIEMWYCSSVSSGEINFNEDKPLPEN